MDLEDKMIQRAADEARKRGSGYTPEKKKELSVSVRKKLEESKYNNTAWGPGWKMVDDISNAELHRFYKNTCITSRVSFEEFKQSYYNQKLKNLRD